MNTFVSIRSSEVDRATLRQVLAECIEYERAKTFRRLLLTRLGCIAGAVWILSWPVHLLPHMALYVALAIVALAAVLSAPIPPAIPDTPPTHR